MNKLLFWFNYTRAYSLPMSVMAWSIPFAFGCFNKGNILYGIIALVGIICAHLGANLFDDIIDYKNYLKSKEKKSFVNLKKGKCQCFCDNSLTMKTAVKTTCLLFLIAIVVGLFFIKIYMLPIILLMGITGVLALIYPIAGRIGLCETIIGTIFSPLLFTGVYYVMTATISAKLLWLSFSFALVTITLLHTDFFLDYTTDKKDGKKTFCTISGSKNNAYYLYLFIIFLIFASIFMGVHLKIFSVKYFLIFLAIPFALNSAKKLMKFIEKDIENEKDFMSAMNATQSFIAIFSILCIVTFYLTR